jgi:CRP-like cAMP-binding protein
MATQGEALHDLKLIYNGEVVVEQDGNEVVHSRDGTLVGEMSFIQGGNATATVRALRPTRYVSWPKEEIRKLLKRNPTMDLAMQTVFSVDLMHKLTGGSAAPRPETA